MYHFDYCVERVFFVINFFVVFARTRAKISRQNGAISVYCQFLQELIELTSFIAAKYFNCSHMLLNGNSSRILREAILMKTLRIWLVMCATFWNTNHLFLLKGDSWFLPVNEFSFGSTLSTTFKSTSKVTILIRLQNLFFAYFDQNLMKPP